MSMSVKTTKHVWILNTFSTRAFIIYSIHKRGLAAARESSKAQSWPVFTAEQQFHTVIPARFQERGAGYTVERDLLQLYRLGEAVLEAFT